MHLGWLTSLSSTSRFDGWTNSGVAILVCLLGASFLAAQAQSPAETVPLKKLTLEELGAVEVTTVSKEPEEVWNTAAAIFVITQDDIRRSGARSLPDILRLAPGVEVAQIDGTKWSVGIRGFGTRLSKSVLVLIDGRSVYTPLFAGVYWEMQHTMIEDIERIEVIRGPGGTIWGSNAVNGVINIITKNARDTQGTMVAAGSGNVEQGFLDFRYGGVTQKGIAYRFYGQGFSRGPQFHRDGRNYDDWRLGQLGFRMDWQHGEKNEFTLSGDTYKADVGQRLNLSTYSPPARVDTTGDIDLLGHDFVFRWKRKFSERSDLQLQAYWDRTHRRDLNFEEIRNTLDLDFVHHVGLSRNDVIWGASIRVSPDQFIQVLPTVDFLPRRQTYVLGSGFLQDEIAIVPNRVSLTVGSKFEHNSYSGFDMQPSVRLLVKASERQSVWASVTRAVRTPSRIEDNFRFDFLAVPAIPLFLRLIGDGQFVPEKMLGYEAGFRTTIRNDFYLDVSTFFNQYDDLLSVESRPLFPETTPSPTHLVLPIFLRNGLEANTAGIEVSPVWQPAEQLTFRLAYSYVNLDVSRKSWSIDASSVRQTEGATPHNKFSVQSLVKLPANFEVDLTYRYTSSLSFPVIPSYSTADARLAWRVHPNLELAFSGRNLLQPYHYEFAADPGPPVGIKRSFYGVITFRK